MRYFSTALNEALTIFEAHELSGEYWLTGNDVIFADGDAGVDVPNHEMVIVAHAMNEVIGILEQNPKFAMAAHIMEQWVEDGIVDVTAAREDLLIWADSANKEGILTDDEVDDIEDTIVQQTEVDRQLLSVAFGSFDDAREYGLHNLGWTRVAGNNIQTVGLTRNKLVSIANGLSIAFDTDISDETLFDIEEYKSHKVYWNVPFYIIESGDMMALRNYLG